MAVKSRAQRRKFAQLLGKKELPEHVKKKKRKGKRRKARKRHA